MMKSSILNIGKALNKEAQKKINGGFGQSCNGFAMYHVSNCGACVNTILPGAPTFCRNNCCVMAY